MGFVRDVVKVGAAATSPFGLASLVLGHKKKKPASMIGQPTMTSNTPYERPMSMIGGDR